MVRVRSDASNFARWMKRREAKNVQRYMKIKETTYYNVREYKIIFYRAQTRHQDNTRSKTTSIRRI